MKICVLNASNPTTATLHLEADEYVDYRQGRASCFNGQTVIKQCRSWHSWTYALETEFFVYGKDKWQGCFQYDAVIILVNRDIADVMPLVKKLKLMKKKVAISFHEGVQDLITGSGIANENVSNRWVMLSDLVKEADFYVNLFGQIQPFFEGWFGKDKVRYCSHGAPIDWDHRFTIPWAERPYDILCGTRTFGQRLSRNTLVALGTLNGLAEKQNLNVHFLSEDGDVAPLLKRIGMNNINVHRGPLSWTDWLKFLAQFKVVAHFDGSMNLGQICYDAAMVDVVPVGSSTWNNMVLGTDDGGSLYKFTLEIIDNLENPEPLFETMNNWKRGLDPECKKEELLEMFE